MFSETFSLFKFVVENFAWLHQKKKLFCLETLPDLGVFCSHFCPELFNCEKSCIADHAVTKVQFSYLSALSSHCFRLPLWIYTELYRSPIWWQIWFLLLRNCYIMVAGHHSFCHVCFETIREVGQHQLGPHCKYHVLQGLFLSPLHLELHCIAGIYMYSLNDNTGKFFIVMPGGNGVLIIVLKNT